MEWITVGTFVLVAIICWWTAGASIRNRKVYQQYTEAVKSNEATVEMSRESLTLTRESNRLRSEELATLRELVAELRAARQSREAPPTRSSDSN